nr:sulfurtransferase complex subunit TusB [Marinibactrum halimedae]
MHIVSRSPYQYRDIEQCLDRACDNDAILLTGDAVFALLPTSTIYHHLKNTSIFMCALEPEVAARGLLEQNVPESTINLISDDDFVQLVCEYSRSFTWF